ncbi:MAG: type II secretion system protein GspN [Spirochaetales bacterium]|nr:type II secretion system protein GspN [Spirochaetales bacterium]
MTEMEEQEAAAAADDLDDFDDYESYSLTTRQKIYTGLTVFLAFLVAIFFFLPYDLVVRSAVAKFGGGQIQLDFDSLNLGVFSADQLTNMRLALGPGLAITAADVESTLSKRHLMAGNARGELAMDRLSVDLGSVEVTTGRFDADLGLNGFQGPARSMSGNVAIKTGPIKLSKLPETLPIPASPDDIKITRAELMLAIQNGRVNLNGTKIDSNLFGITISGTGVAQNSFADMSLDARICLRPAGNLEEQNKTIFDFYVMAGGPAGGQLCFALKGNLDRPDFQKLDS